MGIEQKARDLLDRMGLEQKIIDRLTTGDLGELKNLIHFHSGLNSYALGSHEAQVKAGWWTDIETGERKERNKAELIALIHSELSECLEAVRKNLPDEKLPHRSGEEVELADALIRIFDYAGAYNLDLQGAYIEKTVYNEKEDLYYAPCGWYESSQHNEEFGLIFINTGKITHWMEKPTPPYIRAFDAN